MFGIRACRGIFRLWVTHNTSSPSIRYSKILFIQRHEAPPHDHARIRRHFPVCPCQVRQLDLEMSSLRNMLCKAVQRILKVQLAQYKRTPLSNLWEHASQMPAASLFAQVAIARIPTIINLTRANPIPDVAATRTTRTNMLPLKVSSADGIWIS